MEVVDWPETAETASGEYRVEQRDVLLAWARRQAMKFGFGHTSGSQPLAGPGLCFDCKERHEQRWLIGSNGFCPGCGTGRLRAGLAEMTL